MTVVMRLRSTRRGVVTQILPPDDAIAAPFSGDTTGKAAAARRVDRHRPCRIVKRVKQLDPLMTLVIPTAGASKESGAAR